MLAEKDLVEMKLLNEQTLKVKQLANKAVKSMKLVKLYHS
jgi:hypothetical protein